MTSHNIRPAKRRKTKNNDPMRLDDIGALDTVTVERVTVPTKRGPVEQKIFVPLANTTATTSTNNNAAETTSTNINEYVEPEINEDTEFFNQTANEMEPDETAAAPSTGKKARMINLFVHKKLIYICIETNLSQRVRTSR